MITKKPLNPTLFREALYFGHAARQCWGHILRSLPAEAKILLPSYIGYSPNEGSGIYDPVTASKLEHEFYPLTDTLTVTAEMLAERITSGKYRLILLVHYFGFMVPDTKAIRDLCREHNVILVEDCAHLYGYQQPEKTTAGTYGDFTFYSLHKALPTTTGGMVVDRSQGRLDVDFSALRPYDGFAAEIASYSLPEIIAHRRWAAATLAEKLGKIDGIATPWSVGPEDIPYTYPILVENGLREKLYFWLIERGIALTALYYCLIDPLQPDEYTSMQTISSSILNLPVHPDVTPDDLEEMACAIAQGVAELTA